jgi:hypothetical protein
MRRVPDCSLLTSSTQIEAVQVAIYTLSNAQISQFYGDSRRAMVDITGTVSGGTPSASAMAQINQSGVILFRAEF